MIPKGTPLTADNLNKYFLSKIGPDPQMLSQEIVVDTDSGYPVFIGGRPGTTIMDPPYVDHIGAHFWNDQNQFARVTAGSNSGGIWVSSNKDEVWLGGTSGTVLIRGTLIMSTSDHKIYNEGNHLKLETGGEFWFLSKRSGVTPRLLVLSSNQSANVGIHHSGSAGYITSSSGNLHLRIGSTDKVTISSSEVAVHGDLSFSGTLVSGTVPWARLTNIPSASTSAKGIVQLSTSTSSTSTTLAATPSAVKAAYDLANAALPKSGGTMTGNINMGNRNITNVNNLGVGTSSPSEKLHVHGKTRSEEGFSTGSFEIVYNETTSSLDFIFVG